MKIGKKLCEWDDTDISDPFESQEEYSYLCEYLTEILLKKNYLSYWKVEAVNFGWQNLHGLGYIYAENANNLLSNVLPKTHCIFNVFNYGKGIAIQNFHHDSPTGEWYYILPCAHSTYERKTH